MRWRQVFNEQTGKSEFVPVDETALKADISAGKIVPPCPAGFEPFRSIVDGSIIRDHKDLAAHNKRNNVVNTAEFSPEFIERKAREREDFFAGKVSKEEQYARKQKMHEMIIRAEQGLPY